MTDAPRGTPSGPHDLPASDMPTGLIRPRMPVGIEVYGETNPGRVRPGNEDNLIWEDPASREARAHGTLLVVSDGMGGHAAGEVASDIAVRTIRTRYYQNRPMPPAEAIREAIAQANDAIYQAAQQHREQAGMGCTVVALAVQGADLTIGHVGDSRAYLIRNGRAIQLTADHSWVAMQVREGVLTPEQAEHHPNRSVLMRALGRQANVEVDVSQRQLQPGDILLLCSDGLTGMVSDAEIGEHAARIPARDLPRTLIELANQRGAPDNVTVLIGEIVPVSGSATMPLVDDSSRTTVLPNPSGAPQQPVQASGDAPTDRHSRRAPGGPNVPPVAAAASAGPPTGPAAVPGGTAAAAPPRGRPVVVSRSSTHEPAAGLGEPRRGRGRWVAGALGAFGLAAGLILISWFQMTREPTSIAANTGSSAAATPTAAVAVAPPTAVPTVPPPISAQLPTAVATPPRAAQPGIPTISAILPTAAVVATPQASPGAVSSPSATSIAQPALATAQSILPGVPGLPGRPRTGEAPSTTGDSPNAGTTAPDSGAPAATPAEGEPEAAPEPAPAAAQPAAKPRASDLCARGAQFSPSIAARAGCRTSDNESGQ